MIYDADVRVAEDVLRRDATMDAINKHRLVAGWADPPPDVLRFMRRTFRVVFVPEPDFEVVLRKVIVAVDDRIYVETWERGRQP